MKKIVTALAVASLVSGGSFYAFAEEGHEVKKPGVASEAAKDAAEEAKDEADERPGAYPADNSGRNQRDADGATVTAGDQSNNKGDLEITQAVRKAVVADDSLSVNAQNVKIITNGGVVTLRGPVKSDAEKASIAAKAKAVTGVTRVDNQLEIETN